MIKYLVKGVVYDTYLVYCVSICHVSMCVHHTDVPMSPVNLYTFPEVSLHTPIAVSQ